MRDQFRRSIPSGHRTIAGLSASHRAPPKSPVRLQRLLDQKYERAELARKQVEGSKLDMIRMTLLKAAPKVGLWSDDGVRFQLPATGFIWQAAQKAYAEYLSITGRFVDFRKKILFQFCSLFMDKSRGMVTTYVEHEIRRLLAGRVQKAREKLEQLDRSRKSCPPEAYQRLIEIELLPMLSVDLVVLGLQSLLETEYRICQLADQGRPISHTGVRGYEAVCCRANHLSSLPTCFIILKPSRGMKGPSKIVSIKTAVEYDAVQRRSQLLKGDLPRDQGEGMQRFANRPRGLRRASRLILPPVSHGHRGCFCLKMATYGRFYLQISRPGRSDGYD